MRIDKGMLGWGVFFIVTGAVPLAVEAGLIQPSIVDRWWSYWPLLLVGAGVGLILTRTPFDVVGGLIVAATFGLMVGGALSAGFSGITGVGGSVCGSGDGGTAFAPQTGSFGATADVELELDCGAMTVTTSERSGWIVEGSNAQGQLPRIEASTGSLDVRQQDGRNFILGGSDRLDVGLPATSRLALTMEVNAGELDATLARGDLDVVDLELNAGAATLDLTGAAAIDGIEVSVNAGSLRVALPSLSMTGSIEVNAGSVDLCAPSDVGLRLHTGDSVLSSQDFGAAGLVQDGSTWETPGYDTAAIRIELRTEANVGSFRLNGSGCGT